MGWCSWSQFEVESAQGSQHQHQAPPHETREHLRPSDVSRAITQPARIRNPPHELYIVGRACEGLPPGSECLTTARPLHTHRKPQAASPLPSQQGHAPPRPKHLLCRACLPACHARRSMRRLGQHHPAGTFCASLSQANPIPQHPSRPPPGSGARNTRSPPNQHPRGTAIEHSDQPLLFLRALSSVLGPRAVFVLGCWVRPLTIHRLGRPQDPAAWRASARVCPCQTRERVQ